MLDSLKEKVFETQNEWVQSIENSPDGAVKIDLTTDIVKIFQKFLAHVIFGDQELSFEMIDIKKPGKESVRMPLCEAVEECFQQNLTCNGSRLTNPIWHILYYLTGKCYGFNVHEKTADSNSSNVRAMLTDYVRKRMSGEKKSKLGNRSDLLSLFMDSPEIFNEQAIVDELVDFTIAGTQTTQIVTQNVMAHFATDPVSLKRVRDEFN